MEAFFSTYGPFILLGVFLIYLIGVNIYRNKKYVQKAKELIESLKKGDYVKTYSGFYGTIFSLEEITLENGQVERIVKLEISENNFISIDANAIYTLVNELKSKTIRPKKAKESVEETKTK